ncbi:carbohydrate-binding domain-containing protein [Metabacillus endolithicus]|uniref:Carbohydrate-binding domain-containing protein n=1 Tax=Metabacillus endolithicus TaxID=1535204 RepID=A0ABW5BXJ9_9BACI|nr:carbohydrate-binding domain-containing protein [Metabacillus endolithicus]UPG62709.1 carbohydrate-binding domain-containing protein [Metabacillus endolithicus]
MKLLKVVSILMSSTLLFACANNSTTGTSNSATAETASADIGELNTLISESVSYKDDDFYTNYEEENPTYIELKGSDVSFDTNASVLYSDNTLTIKTGGTYVLSGNLENGQIVVDAEDKNTVRLVLKGVTISSSTSSAIYVLNAEKTTISLVEGTENVINDASEYVYENSSEDEPNSAIYSKDDFTINGTGKLIVHGNYNNGVSSNDKLKITGGNLQIDAVDDGIIGRDLVAVKEGTVTIDAGGDGIRSTNDEDESKGSIVIEGGTYDIASENDGVQAVASLLISDGTFNITSGGGSPETITVVNDMMGKMRGQGEATTSTTTTTTTTTESESYKGLKAVTDIVVGGGTFTIDSKDDAVHSNNTITLAGGDLTIASGDDGIHADTSLVTSGGNIDVTKSYEGMESQLITINGGDINLTTSDDGINVGGGNDGSGNDMHSVSENNLLQINGGHIVVNADGDGLDSNGYIEMTDGTVLVNGPTGNGNGSLDYGGSFTMSGGFLVAAGSSGMLQAIAEESTQNGILMTYPEAQVAGTIIHLEDSEGNSILNFAPEKDYQAVFISSAQLTKKSSYSLYSGGTATGEEVDGLYTNGEYEAGTKIVDFSIADTVTWLNESGVTTAQSSGGPGGFGGGAGGTGERPQMGSRGDMFTEMDEETREKVEAIMEQQRSGEMTQEEAQAQLEELGVEIPMMGERPQMNEN